MPIVQSSVHFARSPLYVASAASKLAWICHAVWYNSTVLVLEMRWEKYELCSVHAKVYVEKIKAR